MLSAEEIPNHSVVDRAVVDCPHHIGKTLSYAEDEDWDSVASSVHRRQRGRPIHFASPCRRSPRGEKKQGANARRVREATMKGLDVMAEKISDPSAVHYPHYGTLPQDF